MSFLFKKKDYGGPVVMGTEAIMSKKAHGTTEKPVQENLRWNVDRKKADKICSYNRHFAEHSLYFQKTAWVSDIKASKAKNPTKYFDSVTGKLLFTAPIGRSVDDFVAESSAHGWPSFRDDEVNWENVRVLPGGETVSVDGTHLGHNLPDSKGNRYCINLVCVAGNEAGSNNATNAENEKEAASNGAIEGEVKLFDLKKDGPGCTGMFFRSDPRRGDAFLLSDVKTWPRDGAQLRGQVLDVNGEKWLKCLEVKQQGDKKFKKVKGKPKQELFMPFRHDQYYLEEATENMATQEETAAEKEV